MQSLLTYLESHQFLVSSVFILGGAFILSGIVRFGSRKYFKIAAEKLNTDLTRQRFFMNILVVIIWLVAIAGIAWMQPKLRALATSLFAGAGLMLVFIGLAAQQAFANLVGGFFIIIFKPFRIGDMIKVGNIDAGIVVDISLRHTVIRNFENNHIFIPNSNVNSDVLVNNSIIDEEVCRHLNIGISYDSDVKKAMSIIVEETEKHPHTIDKRSEEDKKNGAPYINIRMMAYGQSSVDLRAYVWVNSFRNGLVVQSDLLTSIKERFDVEGIEIPFPYRTVVYKKDMESAN